MIAGVSYNNVFVITDSKDKKNFDLSGKVCNFYKIWNIQWKGGCTGI